MALIQFLIRVMTIACCSLVLQLTICHAYCQFPTYLWRTLSDGGLWVTRTSHVGVTDQWTHRREMHAQRDVITVTHVRAVNCTGNDVTPERCTQRHSLHKFVCLSEEPGSSFRVHVKRPKKKAEFTCIRFQKRSSNVVQVWTGRRKDVNEDRLCHANELRRDSWPWLSQTMVEWNPCMMRGGYDFTAEPAGRKMAICQKQWRTSRLEIECAYGEGMTFFFPKPHCSIFGNTALEQNLLCYGSWEENNFRFVILGRRRSQQPQYTLRLPKLVSGVHKFTALLFYNAVSPTKRNVKHGGDLRYVQLHFRRSDSSICHDESEHCASFAREGKCTRISEENARYCKKSCNLCGRQAETALNSECLFPKTYRGHWLFYDDKRAENVTFGSGEVSFSQLGHFICKGRHTKKILYKMITVSTNGCRPRYTCMHFRKDIGNVDALLFKMSKSQLTDNSFDDLCHFEDDDEPVGDSIRSKSLKILLPQKKTRFNSCQLDAMVAATVAFRSTGSCQGTLSDRSKITCKPRPHLSLSLPNCVRREHMSYQCIAHVELTDDHQVLITTTGPDDNKRYQCWVIRSQTNRKRGQYRLWTSLRMYSSGQCGFSKDFQRQVEPAITSLSIALHHEKVAISCGKEDHRTIPPVTTYTEKTTADTREMEVDMTLLSPRSYSGKPVNNYVTEKPQPKTTKETRPEKSSRYKPSNAAIHEITPPPVAWGFTVYFVIVFICQR